MQINNNVSLKQYSTMRLGGNARYLCSILSEKELLEAVKYASDNTLKFKVIGGGSNIIWSENGYDGLVIVNEIRGFKINKSNVTIGSGVNWDEAVKKTVDAGLSGVELLSLIPGKSGAVPIQNVGAYGREISDVLVELRAYDTEKSEFVTLKNENCSFGYRSSRFNKEEPGRYIITELTLELSTQPPSPPFYKTLQEYLDTNKITKYTPKSIREAVIQVRQSRLPDPSIVANNGSFFANPIISKEKYNKLKTEFPDIPGWKNDDSIKVPAAWLIEKAGFSDFHDKETGMGTWPKHPLIVVNESASSIKDLLEFVFKITDAVSKKFDIWLQKEPELIVD